MNDLRRRARLLAFQALFQIDVGKVDPGKALENVSEGEEDADLAFLEEITRGVQEHLEELDRLIGEKALNWKLERLARVDRTLLRIGVYEILHRKDVPAAVAINEAVELAKEYGDERSGGFVNAILDAVRTGEVSSR